MEIKNNYPLQNLNSFGIESYAIEFASVSDLNELLQLIALGREIRILGGGSNILLSADVNCLLIKNNFKSIEIIKDTDEDVYIKAGGGENWHELVLWCIDRNLAGIENLSLIPGTVGAAPIQNIGAYGVELKDVFHELEAVNLETGQLRTFSNEECRFGYRDSIFKRELKGKYFISSVTLKLSRIANFKIAYGDLKNVLGDDTLTLRAISNAVIKIRTSKLPDPKEIGNAGSFFKNPVISIELFRALLEKHPSLPSYPTPEANMVKIPAGWLIEQAGWKGFRKGNIGVHEKQALVLVNYGGGKGSEIYQLALDIKADVFEKFGVEIEPEVNVW
jgi:UDP-N-acetylmuramate dehydrogenase